MLGPDDKSLGECYAIPSLVSCQFLITDVISTRSGRDSHKMMDEEEWWENPLLPFLTESCFAGTVNSVHLQFAAHM